MMRLWLSLYDGFRSLEPQIFAFLASALLMSGYVTFTQLSADFVPTGNSIGLPLILSIDLALLIGLTLLLLLRYRRSLSGLPTLKAGRRLLLRMVLIFTAIALIPTLAITAVSMLLVNMGLQSWFAAPVSRAIEDSRAIAEVYLAERQSAVEANAIGLAGRLAQSESLVTLDLEALQAKLDQEALNRDIAEVLLLDDVTETLSRSALEQDIREIRPVLKSGTSDFSQERTVDISAQAIALAESGQVVPLPNSIEERVSVLLKPQLDLPYFLLVTQQVDPAVLARVNVTKRSADTYARLEGSATSMQRAALLIFGLIGLILALVAAAVGLFFATSLSAPISWLMQASEQVGQGRLEAVRLPIKATNNKDDLGRLMLAFERMTMQLRDQRAALLGANTQLEERNRFTEAVLSGVSAGVIGLNAHAEITLANRRASDLLGVDLMAARGQSLQQLAPELAQLVHQVHDRQERYGSEAIAEQQIALVNRRLTRLELKASVVAEVRGQDIVGYVVTFDDVTELVSAQRSAAWSDVARRVAHEIKNPLTPIQLSTERLKRRYRKQLTEGLETFDLCTDTIIRQVDDIRAMVDEFSSFARSSQPKFQRTDILTLCRQALFLEEQAHRNIRYSLEAQAEKITADVDGRLFNQALLNILRNAAEAIQELDPVPADAAISLQLSVDGHANRVNLQVYDTGPGLPVGKSEQLTDPYVTFKPKGTGLGLAIVKKIIQDHGGSLSIANRNDRQHVDNSGAVVSIHLPLSQIKSSLVSQEGQGQTASNSIASQEGAA